MKSKPKLLDLFYNENYKNGKTNVAKQNSGKAIVTEQ